MVLSPVLIQHLQMCASAIALVLSADAGLRPGAYRPGAMLGQGCPTDEEEYSLNNNRNNNNNRRRGRGNRNQGSGGGGGGGGNNANRIDSRARGNAPQLLDKYKKLAQDAHHNGDRVQMEYYLQFADHYFRVIADNKARQDEQRARRDGERGQDRDDDLDDEDGEDNRRSRRDSRSDNRGDDRGEDRGGNRGPRRSDNDDRRDEAEDSGDDSDGEAGDTG